MEGSMSMSSPGGRHHVITSRTSKITENFDSIYSTSTRPKTLFCFAGTWREGITDMLGTIPVSISTVSAAAKVFDGKYCHCPEGKFHRIFQHIALRVPS